MAAIETAGAELAIAQLTISEPATAEHASSDITMTQTVTNAERTMMDVEAGEICMREQRVVRSRSGRFAVPHTGQCISGYSLFSEIGYRAMQGDEKEVLRLLSNMPPFLENDVLGCAARYGHFGLLKTLVARGLKWDGQISVACVRSGNLEMLAWVYEHFKEHLAPCTPIPPMSADDDQEEYQLRCMKNQQFYDNVVSVFHGYHEADSLTTIAKENGFNDISEWLREKNLH